MGYHQSIVHESAEALQAGLQRAHWSVTDLWEAALAIGGGFSQLDVAHIAAGDAETSPAEHDVLAATLNERLPRGTEDPVPYWRDLLPTIPPTDL